MENHHFLWEHPLLMAIFNSCVKLPEGNMFILVFTMFILSENMGTYGTMMRIPWNIAGFPLNFPNMSLEIILGFSSLIFVFFNPPLFAEEPN